MENPVNKEKKNKVLKLLIFFVIAALFFLIFIILLGFVGYMFYFRTEAVGRMEPNEYQLLQVSSKTGTTSFGYTSMSQKLEDLPSPFYVTKDGDYVLLSELGAYEVRCTGSCSCENGRRTTGSAATVVLKKGLYFLTAGVSLLVASDLAKKYFMEECESQFFGDDQCSSSTRTELIVGEVEDCERVRVEHTGHGWDDDPHHFHVHLESLFTLYDLELKDVEERDPNGKKEYSQWKCRGRCMRNPYEPIKSYNLDVDFSCGDYEVENYLVELRILEWILPAGEDELARSLFQDTHFREFCHKQKPEGIKRGVFCWSLREGDNPTITCEKQFSSKVENEGATSSHDHSHDHDDDHYDDEEGRFVFDKKEYDPFAKKTE